MSQICTYEVLKRGRPLIFSIFWYRFFPKIPKTQKSLKNGFYLIKSHLDQVFRVKIWPNGSIFEFGHFTRVKSREFWKVPKINFFWSEWCQIRSKCSSGLKFWSQALKLAKFWDFWSFSAIFDSHQTVLKSFIDISWFLGLFKILGILP